MPPSAPDGSGWRGRLALFVWRLVAPVFTRQQAFNTAVAQSLERMADALSRIAGSLSEQGATERADLDAFGSFSSVLVQYLQQITPFIDTKAHALEASLDEVRMAAASAQRAALAAERKLDARDPVPARDTSGSAVAAAGPESLGARYIGFEDLFRGTPDVIRARQTDYADRLTGASDVLDVGCGRGEFLELLRDRGIPGIGVDLNAEMVEVCRARGLRAEHADALEYLTRAPEGTVGGLVALQVVEHLEPAYLVRFLSAAFATLGPGATIVLETINPSCWVAFFESYIRDITHVRPLHPDTLKFLVVAAGFERVDVQFRSPIAESGRLQRAAAEGLTPPLTEIVRTLNANVDRLNERLFTYLDYAVVGFKPR
jgi:O-antigen chain-terminating methyltransferase